MQLEGCKLKSWKAFTDDQARMRPS